jgi:NDP-sugar pyrophosphorylase family protein
MQAVILAGGKGKRLFPFTESHTKAMIPVLGLPIIERVMEIMVGSGIDEFVLVVSPKDDEIIHYFQNKSSLNCKINFVFQDPPLGMGDALKQAVPFIHGDFILSSCDNLVEKGVIHQMLEIWKNKKSNGMLSTIEVHPRDIPRMGIVEIEGDFVKKIIEKPAIEEAPSNIGSVPLYIFSPKILKYLDNIDFTPRGEIELQSAIQFLIDKDGFVRYHKINKRWDLTKPGDLLPINLMYFTKVSSYIGIDDREIGHTTQIIHPVVIEEGVAIGHYCRIGPYVYIQSGCKVNDGVTLEKSVVLENCVIESGSIIRECVLSSLPTPGETG